MLRVVKSDVKYDAARKDESRRRRKSDRLAPWNRTRRSFLRVIGWCTLLRSAGAQRPFRRSGEPFCWSLPTHTLWSSLIMHDSGAIPWLVELTLFCGSQTLHMLHHVPLAFSSHLPLVWSLLQNLSGSILRQHPPLQRPTTTSLSHSCFSLHTLNAQMASQETSENCWTTWADWRGTQYQQVGAAVSGHSSYRGYVTGIQEGVSSSQTHSSSPIPIQRLLIVCFDSVVLDCDFQQLSTLPRRWHLYLARATLETGVAGAYETSGVISWRSIYRARQVGSRPSFGSR